ncbi:Stk1 family PASTA domain-containing Ser/Thr kinase [Streptomyces sp. B6B3]|uniref:Stk1 family PASTA domain-containing Ser/Thr kinase n=1 Tax=Streptomyces sp. B6B3 TaxID=3153570 RepID=UPI00325F0B1E
MDAPRRLADRYELRKMLGRGGMAEVHLGHDTRLERQVAVKTLLPDLARDPAFQARFRREAHSSASLNHPAIVAVYDTGEEAADDLTVPYIVMEYVEGVTLRELLRSGRKPSPERAMELCVGVLRALEYSHHKGIVHRDIKPANIMLAGDGQVKVMDFGIARALGEAGMTMTHTAAVLGTAHYLSPEQARGEKVDARTDLYSAGCLLYELLTERPPFVGDSPVSVAFQHVSEEPRPPSELAPGISADLDAIVLGALVKDREHRYQSAGEMRADLESALAGGTIAATAQRTADLRPAASAAPAAPVDADTERGAGAVGDGARGGAGGPGGGGPAGTGSHGRRRSRLPRVLLAVGAVLLLVAAGVFGGSLLGGGEDGTVAVPDLVGLTVSQAEDRAAEVGLSVDEKDRRPCPEDRGTVCATTPGEGEEIAEGGTVSLVVSEGRAPVEVPDVVGDAFADALDTLQEAGFRVAQETDDDTDQAAGTVLDQDPPGGRKAEPGTTVTLTVAGEAAPDPGPDPTPDDDQTDEPDPPTDPETVEVPDVTGLFYAEAEAQLIAAGFTVDRWEDVETHGVEPDTVVAQDPPGGTQLEPGGVVTLTVEPPLAEIVVPDVAGLTYEEAEETLIIAGLSTLPASSPDPTAGCEPDDTVLHTSPPAGSTATEGDHVEIVCDSTE